MSCGRAEKTAVEKGVAAGHVQPQSRGKSGVHVSPSVSSQDVAGDVPRAVSWHGRGSGGGGAVVGATQARAAKGPGGRQSFWKPGQRRG